MADEDDEEFNDEFDDESDLFSFYNFSKQHFQNNADHKHTTLRLKEPLLQHEDEGDALVRPFRDKTTICPTLHDFTLTHHYCRGIFAA